MNRESRLTLGLARLIAIGYPHDTYAAETGPLDTQAVAEPSTMGRRASVDEQYVPAEPSVVVLVNAARTSRYIVVVRPSGEVVLGNQLALSSSEYMGGDLHRGPTWDG